MVSILMQLADNGFGTVLRMVLQSFEWNVRRTAQIEELEVVQENWCSHCH